MHAAAEIDRLRRHPYPQPRPRRDQVRPPRTAASTRDNVAVSTPFATRILASPSTISIAPAAVRISARAPACGSPATTFTGAKVKAEEIGAASGALLVVMSPANACPRHVDNIFAFTRCRAATSDTFAPATRLSATITALRAADHRRLRAPERSPPSPPSPNRPPPSTMPSIAAPSVNQQRTTSSQHARKICRCRPRNGYEQSLFCRLVSRFLLPH
jgi:hypothetical protein